MLDMHFNVKVLGATASYSSSQPSSGYSISNSKSLVTSERRNNELTRRCVEPWHENSINVTTKCHVRQH
jgi:hypothetical protein